MSDLFTRTKKILDPKWSQISDACRAIDKKSTGGLNLDQLAAVLRGFGADVTTLSLSSVANKKS